MKAAHCGQLHNFWCDAFSPNYRFEIYDALIAAAALQAKSSVLYSEDFQDGQVIEEKLTVKNPFA